MPLFADRSRYGQPPLLALGLVAFLLAVLSIVDMYLPRPYDGVVLEADTPGRLAVRRVVPNSGAALAGIRPGDHIVGIARSALASAGDAATLLNQHNIGETVPYLVRSSSNRVKEVDVRLGRRRIGDTAYLYACVLGFSFFFIGLFVLMNQPQLRASQLFFVLCSLFLLFLICRLRPASYSWVDLFVLNTGTAALLFLPPTFLHFFLIFPRPIWTSLASVATFRAVDAGRRHAALWVVYLIPLFVFALSLAIASRDGRSLSLISGAPVASWWVLAFSILLGLVALAVNARQLSNPRERQGAIIVLLGSVFGLLPFLVLAVAFPSFQHTEQFLFYGIIPLILIPLTFAYAIVRFGLLDVKVILRKSLLYTLTTAAVTLFYAVGIAFFNGMFRGTEMSTSRYFPIVFALTIVLLFEPLRRRIQVPVDRFFFARRARLQSAIVDMGEAFTGEINPARIVRDLVEQLPRYLELEFAALYLSRGGILDRAAGPESLPQTLPLHPELFHHLRGRPSVSRLEDLSDLGAASPRVALFADLLRRAGIEVIGDLASSRRTIGLVLLAPGEGKLPLESEELQLLRGLLNQAAIALETGILLEERARQAELERELEIAAAIQKSLLPESVQLGEQWEVAAVCRPARQVGGDFFAEIPGPQPGSRALVYGDVSGKSVSGALMMMAAKEALHSLASVHSDPEELFLFANRRLYELGNRSFVALGYFASAGNGNGLSYVIAGQPQPLKRCVRGEVSELPLPDHRLPLGAMSAGRHQSLNVPVAPGEAIIAYSDGVVEAQSPTGEFFGFDRLAEVVRRSDAGPSAIVRDVLDSLEKFTAGQEPYDDVTLMVIARRPEAS